MKKIQPVPNEKYLHQIEDELYQYAVNHPDEYIGTNLSLYASPEFTDKLYQLYSFGEYNNTYCKRREYVKEHPMMRPLIEFTAEFIRKHPQWRDLYYYDEDELDLEE